MLVASSAQYPLPTKADLVSMQHNMKSMVQANAARCAKMQVMPTAGSIQYADMSQR